VLSNPVLTSDASISLSIRNLCASQDGHDISISIIISIRISKPCVLLMLMLMLESFIVSSEDMLA